MSVAMRKVPVCGQVQIPAGGQLKVPVPRSYAGEYFLAPVGHIGGSPYLFKLSAAGGTGDEEDPAPP